MKFRLVNVPACSLSVGIKKFLVFLEMARQSAVGQRAEKLIMILEDEGCLYSDDAGPYNRTWSSTNQALVTSFRCLGPVHSSSDRRLRPFQCLCLLLGLLGNQCRSSALRLFSLCAYAQLTIYSRVFAECTFDFQLQNPENSCSKPRIRFFRPEFPHFT